jgi:hypothetical protein
MTEQAKQNADQGTSLNRQIVYVQSRFLNVLWICKTTVGGDFKSFYTMKYIQKYCINLSKNCVKYKFTSK